MRIIKIGVFVCFLCVCFLFCFVFCFWFVDIFCKGKMKKRQGEVNTNLDKPFPFPGQYKLPGKEEPCIDLAIYTKLISIVLFYKIVGLKHAVSL